MTDVDGAPYIEVAPDDHRRPDVDPFSIDVAVQAADIAAQAAAVRVRPLVELTDLDIAHRLFDSIWHFDQGRSPVPIEMLRALTKSGNYVAGAFDGDTLVGACVGFFGAPAGEVLHSHIAGVSSEAAGRQVGFALKLHQRAWGLLRGVSTVEWTFDPLVARNAYFNLAKLGAAPAEYLPNFYGFMNDGINGADDTDRLLVTWELQSPVVAAACAGVVVTVDVEDELAKGAAIGLSRGTDGEPVPGRADADTVLVAVPQDIESLRDLDRARAEQWRLAVRQVLAPLLLEGARITAFDRVGWYVVTRYPDRGQS
jgi:predicted GNAT superfamily acetyltransferase